MLAHSINLSIVWYSNDLVYWAEGCAFRDIMPFKNVSSSWDFCGSICLSYTGCTHFSWISHSWISPGIVQNDTCYLQSGIVGESYAINFLNSSINLTIPATWSNFTYNCGFVRRRGEDFTFSYLLYNF